MSCDICTKPLIDDEENDCPCGKTVCDGCTEPIYSDEVCCSQCAKDLREEWAKCPHPTFEEPYENEQEQMIAECATCSFPKLVGSPTGQEKKNG